MKKTFITRSMLFRLFCITVLLSANYTKIAAQKTDIFLLNLLQKSGKFEDVLSKPDVYQTQIIYTQIDRDAKNVPHFKSYTYNLDPKRYFYPASTVKFPAVLLTLEKLNSLKINGLNKYSTMLTDGAFSDYRAVTKDSTSANGLPSVAHYVKKILLVSDNDAFNRLYEFIGQYDFNEKLHAKGYNNLRILHRLSIPMSKEQNALTNAIKFEENGKIIYEQAEAQNTKKYFPKDSIKLGAGYMQGEDLVKKPYDFTNKNFFALTEQQNILKAALFPEAVSPEKRFNLSPEDYQFVYQYMSQFPRETTFPKYDSTEYWDSFCKFTMFGDNKKPIPKNIRIFNKVGDAYGFLLDNAYVVDFDKKIEFMLTTVIYCNADGVFNDDKYDYDTIGFPFLANLGKVIYEYESTRKKKNLPDLSKFRLKYDK